MRQSHSTTTVMNASVTFYYNGDECAVTFYYNGDECVSHILLTKVMNASVTFYYNGNECVSHILLQR